MNQRDIALATLERRPASRPSAALLSAGCWTINRQGYTLQDIFGRPALLTDLVVGTHAFAPSDIVWVGSGYHNLAIGALGGKLKFRVRGAPDVVGAPPPDSRTFKPDSQIDPEIPAI